MSGPGCALPGEMVADRLQRLYETYDLRHLEPDPLAIVREYSDERDQEIVGLFAAALAFGGVKQIMRSVRDLMQRMGGQPYRFVSGFDPGRDGTSLADWYHRFIRGADVAALCWSVRRRLAEHGSLGSYFLAGMCDDDRDIGGALTRFVDGLRDIAECPVVPGAHFRHLLSSPRDGSACKRMNLYLRWMVRRESPDLGLWTGVPTSHLVIPVDTHIARISRNIGLTKRATSNWNMAREITDRLADIDAADPVKFDYALCRLGILDHCPRRRDPHRCADCVIRDICVL